MLLSAEHCAHNKGKTEMWLDTPEYAVIFKQLHF